MQNKLKREQIFSRLNVAKINQQWRQILRQIKCVELKQELEDLRKWFDYTLTKKNRMIETVLTDLNNAESQYSKMHWSHMETFDKMIKLHSQRVDHYYVQYKEKRRDRYRVAIADINEIRNSYRKDVEQLHAALYRTEESFTQQIALITTQHVSKIDELRNNMLTDLEGVKNSSESYIETLWQEFEKTLKQYWEQTEDRYRQYVIMRNTDYENCRQIFDNNQQINATIDVINNLKDQLTKSQVTGSQLISDEKINKENSRKLFYKLKREVVSEMETDKQHLKFMNFTAGKATDELNAILREGEQILKLFGLCTNLETENEQLFIDRFEALNLSKEEENEVKEHTKKYTEPMAEKVSEVLLLNEFWKRHNRALLEKEALVLHHQFLLKEMNYLKGILRNYFSEQMVKQPESKVSYANGVKFLQRRPATSIPLTRKTKLSALSATGVTQTSSATKLMHVDLRKSAGTGKC
ncbi:hypothetical protein RUM43_003379 [Polyplax serrata]|uniref:Dynein regulatory complex subunit 2 n=1 Tax=Polyplax serrata TaxID=468196 RepID=A0AAN8PPA6_POLSC